MDSFIKFSLIFIYFQSICFGSLEAVKGKINLKNFNFQTKEKIELNGEWLFFWKRIIRPEEITVNGIPKNGVYIQVPGLWSSLKDPKEKDKRLNLGFGTYILEVKGLNFKGKLGFELPYFATAFESYIVQGNQVIPLFSSGKVGKVKSDYIPTTGQKTTELNLKSERFYIVFHGANFDYRSGGFFGALEMGVANVIKKEMTQNNFVSFFVLGITFIISLYHFGLFSIRRKDIGSLWFGLFCLTFFFRELSTENFLSHFIDKSSFIFVLNSKIEYISLFLLPPIQLLFMKSILKNCFHKKIVVLYVCIGLLYAFFTLFTPMIIFTQKMNTFSYQLLVGISYITYTVSILVRAAFKNVEYSRVLLLAIFFLFFGVVYDILVNNNFIMSPFIAPYTFIVFIFIQSYILATKFSFAFNTAENLSLNLEREVLFRTKEAIFAKNEALESEKNISNLLNNMRQSIFSVGNKGIIIPPVSQYSYKIFGQDIKGKTIFETLLKDFDLTSEVCSQFNFIIDISIDSELFQFEILKDNLPEKISFLNRDKRKNSLKINFVPILDKTKRIEKIMFVVEDVTELEKLEREARESEEISAIKIQRLQEIVSNEKKDFQVFLRDVNLNLNSAEHSIKSIDLDELFRVAHTIKGVSRLYNLRSLSSEIHLFEVSIQNLKNNFSDKLKLQEDMIGIKEEIKNSVNNYLELAREIFGDDVDQTISSLSLKTIEISRTLFFSSIEKIKKIADETNRKELLVIIKKLELEDFKGSLLGLNNVVSKISNSLNKEIDFNIEGDSIYLDFKTSSMLKDSLMHLIQNSCDHGIKEKGVINVELFEKEIDIVIKISDDGEGIDPLIIKRKALKKRIITQEEADHLEKEEIFSLIMRPGFSTKESATEYSGRGVGLDVVQSNIQKLKGSIEINSSLSHGTIFIIRIPKQK